MKDRSIFTFYGLYFKVPQQFRIYKKVILQIMKLGRGDITSFVTVIDWNINSYICLNEYFISP